MTSKREEGPFNFRLTITTNATNSNIVTAEANDGTLSYGAPRMIEIGLRYRP